MVRIGAEPGLGIAGLPGGSLGLYLYMFEHVRVISIDLTPQKFIIFSWIICKWTLSRIHCTQDERGRTPGGVFPPLLRSTDF
jgi:hypothetical protein